MHNPLGLICPASAAAMTLEALMANLKPYDERLHKLRGFQGAVTSAGNIKKIIDDSDLLKGMKVRVQDAYSMRSTPQVLGAMFPLYNLLF